MAKPFTFLAFSNFFFFLGNSFFHLFPKYLGDLHASETYIGIIMGLTPGVLVIFTYFFKNSIDFLNKKKFLIFSAVMSMFIYIGYFFFANLATIPFFRVLQGIAFAFGFTFGTSLAIEIIPEKKRTGLLGIFGISGALTNMAAPFIGEWLYKTYHFKYIFLAAVGTAILGLIFVLLVRYKEENLVKSKTPSLSLLIYKKLAVLGILFGAIFSAFYSFISHYVDLLNLKSVSYFFTAYTSCVILVRLIFYNHLNQWNKQKVIYSSVFIAIAGLLGGFFINFFTLPIILVFMGACYGTAHGFLYPSVNILFVDLSPKRRGTATLIFIMLFNLGYLFSSTINGIIADILGYPYMYLIFAVVATILLIFNPYHFNNKKQNLN